MDAVDEVVVLGGEVGVAVDEGGVAVRAQEVVGSAGVEVHQVTLRRVGFGLFGVFALLAQRGGDGFAFGEWFGEEDVAPRWIAHLRAESLVVSVVGAQQVAVRKDELPSG